jgi:hypothetical protein
MPGVLFSAVLSVLSGTASASPSAATPPPVLVHLLPRLQALLQRHHPGLRLEIRAAGLVFEHDTHTFVVPEYVKAGEPRREYEMKGPRPCAAGKTGHGILGTIQVVPGRYAGQRAVPPGAYFQSDSGKDFLTLWGVVPSPKDTEHLDVYLLYPACTDAKFLRQFREIVQDAWRAVE